MDREILEYIERVHKFFKKNGLTLSIAESCTGGLISHYITTLPGASTFFEAGVIPYSAEAKQKILGISSGTISKFGVVSEETAKEMSVKMRALNKTDVSLSITGNLGPDVLEGKEKGLIYIAVSKKEDVFSKQIRLTGTREENNERASLQAIKFLMDIMEK